MEGDFHSVIGVLSIFFLKILDTYYYEVSVLAIQLGRGRFTLEVTLSSFCVASRAAFGALTN